jgi:hypothetical protein
MKNKAQKLRYCIGANICLLIMITIPIILLDNGTSSYFKWGWSDNLVLISIPINTKARYISVCVYIVLIKASGVLIGEIANPILGFNIYNPDKMVITEFTKNELQLYGNSMWFIDGFKRLMLIMVSITQIDLALIGMLSSEIMAIFTIRMLLDEKEFKNNVEEIDNIKDMEEGISLILK